MLVVVPLMFLHQEAGFNAPAVAGAQIAAFMNIRVAERLAAEPGVAGLDHNSGQ